MSNPVNSKDSQLKRVSFRRTAFVAVLVVIVLLAFIARLVDIQIVNAQAHVADSKSLSLGGSQVLYGTRGAIVDRNGQALADSIVYYDCQLDPVNITDFQRKVSEDESERVTFEQAAEELSQPSGKSAEEIRSIAARALEANPNSHFAYLAQHLSTEQFREIAALKIPYVACIPHPDRSYPDGAVAGNIVGFMGSDDTPLAGIELFENQCLQAENGTRKFMRGTSGEIIPGTQVDEPAIDGGTVTLTIDRDLQWYLQQLIAEQVKSLGALNGSITVAEVATGKLRAIAEYPTVDPNNINASKIEDMGSRVFTQSFEPGSTFKALNAAMIIDAAGVKQNDTVSADYLEFFANGARVRDATYHSRENYTLTGSLIDSSNVATSKFAERLKPEKRYEYYKKFGVAEGSSIDFGDQATGFIRDVSDWDNQTYYNISFGQGLTTTVPELVGAYQTLANDGKRMPLSLIESCVDHEGNLITQPQDDGVQVVSAETAKSVTEMLENVVTQSGLRDYPVPGYRYAAKTGTAEKVDPNTGQYKDEAYVTTLIGYAPADAPQYVVSVTLDEPKRLTASSANFVAFQQAMIQVMKTFRVMPSQGEAPVLDRVR